MEKTIEGWLCGALGVLIFSGSMPATRAALAGFDPLFLTAARAMIAGLAAAALLVVFRQTRPTQGDFISLGIVAVGAVLGFPLLSAMALQHINAAQSQIFLGMLPCITALFGVVRGGERPRVWFWVFAGLGSACVIAVALRHGMALSRLGIALMLAAIIVCGLGYAEGAKIARKLGGWQTICWALVTALPVAAMLSWLNQPASFARISTGAWAGLAYVALFSMLIGFVFWYRGLALGGITKVGQIQLLQPGLGLIASAVILHETVPRLMIVAIVGIIACVGGARRFG